MSASKIGWTENTANPTVGCTKKSAGCTNCYAIREAWKLMHNPNASIAKKYEGTVYKTVGGKLNWTGRINFDYSVLKKTVANKKPTLYFVNSMSDLFHPNLSFETIDIIFASFAASSQHRYQVLTKHPERAVEWFNSKREIWKDLGIQTTGERVINFSSHYFNYYIHPYVFKWPLLNVAIGASMENQAAGIERMPYLLQIPAAIRFISAEPLIGMLDLIPLLNYPVIEKPKLDWVIAGGESGHEARIMHPDWPRLLRDQCKAMGIPYFFKQWGMFIPFENTAQPPFLRQCNTGQEYDAHGLNIIDAETSEPGYEIIDGKKYRWEDVLKHIEHDTDGIMTNYLKTGKKISGNLLDGVRHEEFPVNWAK